MITLSKHFLVKSLILLVLISGLTLVYFKTNVFSRLRFKLPYPTDIPVFIPYPEGIKMNQATSLQLSKFDDKSVWLQSPYYCLNIDFENKKATQFVDKFEINESAQFWANTDFEVDSVAKTIWYAKLNQTYAFNILTKEKTEYNYVGSYLSICRTNNKLWLGTTQGLFFLDEKSNQLIGIPAICNVAVKKIKQDDNYLIINDIYKFDFKNNKLENLEHRNKDNDYRNVLGTDEGKNSWYGHETKFCMSINNERYEIFDFKHESIIAVLNIEDKILVFTDYNAVVFSKEYINLHKKPFIEATQKESALTLFIIELNDSLSNKNGILEKIEVLEFMKSKYLSNADSAIQFEITQLPKQLNFDILDTFRYQEARIFIDKNIKIKPEYKTELYQSIIKTSTVWARVTLACNYFDRMKKEGLIADKKFTDEMNIVLKTKNSLDSLRNLNLADDYLLWHTGQIVTGLFYDISWNNGEYGEEYDGEKGAALDFYRQLYTKYPQSEWADDADWIVNGNCLPNDTCGPSYGSEECITYCQSFLKRYPNSNLRKDAYKCIISNYCNMDGEEIKNLKYVRDGISVAEKAIKEFPEIKTKNNEAINNQLVYLKNALKSLAWELKVSLSKEIYKKGEPIVLKATLLRNDAIKETGEIEYKTNTPNCYVELHGYNTSGSNYFRENPYCPEVKFLKKKLSSGQSITEQFDLTKNVRISDYIKDGLFILPPGEYQIKVFWVDLAESEELTLTVE